MALVLVLAAACKDDAPRAPAIDPELAAKAAQAEQDLLARRDALVASRRKLADDSAALRVKIDEARAAGGDTAALEAELAALSTQQDANQDEIVRLLEQQSAAQKAELAALRAAPAGGGAASAELAQVMAKLAQRDEQLRGLTEQIAKLTDSLATLRVDVGKQVAACGQPAAMPTTIIQTVDAKGSKYSKREVEPLLARARSNMSKKGVLASDLPGPAQGLEREATSAMGEADFGKAYFAASQLVATVDAIKIDRAFISGKMGRLSARMKGRKLDEAKQAQVEGLFRDATARYGDGDFAGANRALNQIAAAI